MTTVTAAEPAAAPRAGVPRHWKVFGVTSLAVFMFFLDATIVNVAFPAIKAAFPGTSQAGLSWVINAYTIVFAALLVAAGRFADLTGRRRMFLTGVLLFTAASVLCGAAPTVPLLIAGRAVQAIGGAMVVPAALSLLLPEFPASQRATAVGLWSAVAAVAAAIGPMIGSALTQWGSWRWIFLLNLPVGAIALVLGARILRESRDTEARAPDMGGVVVLGAAMAALALAIVQGQGWGWTDGRILLSFGIALAGLAVFIARSARHDSPAVDLALFRDRPFAIANVASMFFGMGFFAAMLNNVLFLTEVWHYSLIGAGLAITPGPITAAVAAGIGGKLADKHGYRVVIVPGCLIGAASSLWLGLRVGPVPDYFSDWLPGAVMLGVGIGLGFATLGGAAVAALPAPRFAVGSAVLSTARQLGGVVGVAALVAVLGTGGLGAFDRGWTLIGVSILAAGVASIWLGPVRSLGAQQAPVRAVDGPAPG